MPNDLPTTLTADLTPRVNLALQQTHVPFFRSLEVRNSAATPLTDVQVAVSATPAFFSRHGQAESTASPATQPTS